MAMATCSCSIPARSTCKRECFVPANRHSGTPAVTTLASTFSPQQKPACTPPTSNPARSVPMSSAMGRAANSVSAPQQWRCELGRRSALHRPRSSPIAVCALPRLPRHGQSRGHSPSWPTRAVIVGMPCVSRPMASPRTCSDSPARSSPHGPNRCSHRPASVLGRSHPALRRRAPTIAPQCSQPSATIRCYSPSPSRSRGSQRRSPTSLGPANGTALPLPRPSVKHTARHFPHLTG